MSRAGRVKELVLHTTQGEAGTLLRQSQFVLRYRDEALPRPELAISLTMPPRPEGWISNRIPPVLAMNLPEGFLRDRVLRRYRKVMEIDDDMNMLAVTSTPTAGRVWASAPQERQDRARTPLALRDILAQPGTEELFDELLERYATASISGVQPKVVVPERHVMNEGGIDKSAIKSPDLIVKWGDDEYPGLAENEFLCLSVAAHAGLETPEFHLSQDRRFLVVRRFDVGPEGYLGFEDMASLTGRHPEGKYDGSYGEVAKVVALNAAPLHRTKSLEDLFRLIVLNGVLRNGDAHLKNFGILYGDPATADRDARLAPAYDLVCTTMYIKNDRLALGIAGSRAWPGRRALEKFGAAWCLVARPGRVVAEVIEQAMDYRPGHVSKMWRALRREMEIGVRTTEGS